MSPVAGWMRAAVAFGMVSVLVAGAFAAAEAQSVLSGDAVLPKGSVWPVCAIASRARSSAKGLGAPGNRTSPNPTGLSAGRRLRRDPA